MEAIAFGDFQFHAMSHRAGVLGMDRPLPAVAKYALQYLFVQAEFGLMCPISVTDTSIHLIRKFASADLQDYSAAEDAVRRPRHDVEGHAVHDRARRRLRRRQHRTTRRASDGTWRLMATNGSARMPTPMSPCCWRGPRARRRHQGLALFAMPRRLEDGSRNAYRIVRLKDKLGTRSMASGEILLEGAEAWIVGEADRGLKQMMEQVNLSRLSHGVRAAAMMRRCVNEAMVCARPRRRSATPSSIIRLLRRQLLKSRCRPNSRCRCSCFAASAWTAPMPDQGCERTACASDAAASNSAPAATIFRWRPARWKCAAATAISRNGCRPAGRATPISACSWEGHQQHQRARLSVTRAVGKSGRTAAGDRAAANCWITRRAIPARSAIACAARSIDAMAFAERVRGAIPDGANRAAGGQRALSHHQRDLMTAEAARPRRCPPRARMHGWCSNIRLSAQDPLALGEEHWDAQRGDLAVGA
jgi:alkylation response protein AidB-like acyl-CoA dehydrogenase